MIIRDDDGRGLVIVAQTDHSRFVGQLAARWGNERFATPTPYESVVRAATFHDFGWLRYETSPLVDAQTGRPYQFLQLPQQSSQLAAYQWSIDWMADIDPYAGLIVSMHRTGLWKGRYGTIKHPQSYNLKDLSPEVQALVDRNEAWQERQRSRFDDRQVWINYRLMQVWDQLGLYFSCQDPYDDCIEPVPADYDDRDGGVQLRLSSSGGRRVSFDPYPFDVRPLHVQLLARRLPTRAFSSVEDFRRAYFGSELQLLTFELQ